MPIGDYHARATSVSGDKLTSPLYELVDNGNKAGSTTITASVV